MLECGLELDSYGIARNKQLEREKTKRWVRGEREVPGEVEQVGGAGGWVGHGLQLWGARRERTGDAGVMAGKLWWGSSSVTTLSSTNIHRKIWLISSSHLIL